MKIVTYNLRFGGRKNNRVHWRKIFDSVDPDIFLVQETCSPDHYLPADFCEANQNRWLWMPVNSKNSGDGWGSALYIKRGTLKPLELPGYEGWVVGGEVEDFGWPSTSAQPLRIFSLHAPTFGRNTNYLRSVRSVLETIVNLYGSADLIIGGDFNISVAYRHPGEAIKQTQANLNLLADIQNKLALINCWQTANPDQPLPQTLRWSGNKTFPYHCDGIFISAGWRPYLLESRVLTQGWESLSDHNPVVATFAEV